MLLTSGEHLHALSTGLKYLAREKGMYAQHVLIANHGSVLILYKSFCLVEFFEFQTISLRIRKGSSFQPIFWELWICFNNMSAGVQKDSFGNG